MTICMGTACYVNGAAALLRTAHEECQCEENGTTDSLRLRSAHCLGACGRGPLLQVDHRTIVDARTEDVSNAIAELQDPEG